MKLDTQVTILKELPSGWYQQRHENNEILAKLSWKSLEALSNRTGLTGICWQRVTGKIHLSFAEIADQYECSEDRVKSICSDIVRQLLVMGFRPVFR